MGEGAGVRSPRCHRVKLDLCPGAKRSVAVFLRKNGESTATWRRCLAKILQCVNGAVLGPVSFYHWTPDVGLDAYCVVKLRF